MAVEINSVRGLKFYQLLKKNYNLIRPSAGILIQFSLYFITFTSMIVLCSISYPHFWPITITRTKTMFFQPSKDILIDSTV